MTREEFMNRAADAAYLGDESPLKGYVDDLFDELERLRAERDQALKATEEAEHEMHMRIRAGYDRTIADAWRKRLDEVERERNGLRSEVDRLRHERRMFRRRIAECLPWVGRVPYPNTPGFSEMIACRDLAKDTLEEVPE